MHDNYAKLNMYINEIRSKRAASAVKNQFMAEPVLHASADLLNWQLYFLLIRH